MAIFDYMDVGSKGSVALVADALALTLYSYHNLDNGFHRYRLSRHQRAKGITEDSIADAVSDLLAAFGPDDYARNYSANAFDTLLGKVAAFASAQGLGGLAVNSLAGLGSDHWAGQ